MTFKNQRSRFLLVDSCADQPDSTVNVTLVHSSASDGEGGNVVTVYVTSGHVMLWKKTCD